MWKIQLPDILGAVSVNTFWAGVITADCEVPLLPIVCFAIAALAWVGWYIESGAGRVTRKHKKSPACWRRNRRKHKNNTSAV